MALFKMELFPLNLPASTLDAEATHGNGRLHGTKTPTYEIQKELPWHRQAALMFAAGAVTITEVAQAFGVKNQTVGNLLRQPWFQERVNLLMAEKGGRDVMAMFRAETYGSIVTLIELRDSDKVPSPVRRACAVDILDRALGKPLQRVESSNVPTSDDPVAEVKRLEEANERLRAASLRSPTVEP